MVSRHLSEAMGRSALWPQGALEPRNMCIISS